MAGFSGSDLAALRGRFDLSQEELAETLDVARTTVTRWEGEREDLPKLVRFALAAWVHGLPAMGEDGRK